MFKNFLTVFLRNIKRQKAFSFINITGLATGISCCLLIAIYVYDEWSFDRYLPEADRIVRVISTMNDDEVLTTPSMLAPLAIRSIPEVERAARLYNVSMFGPIVVRYEDRQYEESRFYYGDSTAFEVLQYKFIAGNPAEALNRPNTIVLSELMARKYFGDQNPLGKTLTVQNNDVFEVTGVIADLPARSHLQFDFLASLVTLKNWSELKDEEFRSANFLTYFLLRDKNAAAPVEIKVNNLVQERFGEELHSSFSYGVRLQRLVEIHLYHEGNISYVYIFSAIALLVLLIACINFMNLVTARSADRAKEVGVRKVAGAAQSNLVRQFLSESVFLVFVSTVIAVILTYSALPLLNKMSGKIVDASILQQPMIMLLILVLIVSVGIVAGGYPAFILSRFRPVQVLKGTFNSSRQGRLLRKLLVVFQFSVVVCLIVCVAVIYKQLGFVRESNLGFDREQIVVLSTGDRETKRNLDTIKREILALPEVTQAAAITSLPGNMFGGYTARVRHGGEERKEMITGVQADPDVLATLGIELAAGHPLPDNPSYSTEQGYAFLLNETAANKFGWTPEEAVDQPFRVQVMEGKVVGVMKDFHFASMHQPIEPLVFWLNPPWYEYLMVKFRPGQVDQTLASIREVWKRLVPHRPFTYEFLDRQYDALYRAEQRVGQIVVAFTLIAIFIACLGLFGLAAYMTEQRKKEIGIRKALGAEVFGITVLLAGDFVRLVVIAFFAALPIAYLAAREWLSRFAYQATLSWDLFIWAGVLSLLIAIASVSYQTVRAARMDPVRAIRYE